MAELSAALVSEGKSKRGKDELLLQTEGERTHTHIQGYNYL